MAGGKLELILLWHMHQPDYRDHADGGFVLPWVYLHAIKDYADMAAHLERHPQIRATVNFVPVLLDQIDDYAAQFAAGHWRDPLLSLLAKPDMDTVSTAERRLLLDSCFRSNHLNMISPFPRYQRLYELFRVVEGEPEMAERYFSSSYLADLVTWYHLAWTGETVRRQYPLIAELMSKGEGFSHDDRQRLIALMGQIIAGIVPRYRALAERGQIELSTTPQTHPLAPLLLDFASARDAEPKAVLPQAACYPGGRARVGAQVAAALASHAACFGAAPAGVWPAEGGVSDSFVKMLAVAGIRWSATGESVLVNSLRRETSELPGRQNFLYCPYKLAECPELTLFFRDERLSDLIGFEYRRWHGRDAAADFVNRLRAIRQGVKDGHSAVVTVILDGENAWEYYPYNGYYFLEDLYRLLEADPELRTTTFSDYLDRQPHAAETLAGLEAGSWVYGSFSTWIGESAKNKAWDLLCAAKQTYDMVIAGGRLNDEEMRAAEAQLAVCESSDWFWWLGVHNPARAVTSFESLFRRNLANLYRRIKVEPPAVLSSPLSRGGGTPEGGGTMRRGG